VREGLLLGSLAWAELGGAEVKLGVVDVWGEGRVSRRVVV
jgi:hypothetical protein